MSFFCLSPFVQLMLVTVNPNYCVTCYVLITVNFNYISGHYHPKNVCTRIIQPPFPKFLATSPFMTLYLWFLSWIRCTRISNCAAQSNNTVYWVEDDNCPAITSTQPCAIEAQEFQVVTMFVCMHVYAYENCMPKKKGFGAYYVCNTYMSVWTRYGISLKLWV